MVREAHRVKVAATFSGAKMYLIWSVKMNAWWGNTSTYTSDIKNAKQFTREKAVAFCKARYNGQLDAGLNCIPVDYSLIEEVEAK